MPDRWYPDESAVTALGVALDHILLTLDAKPDVEVRFQYGQARVWKDGADTGFLVGIRMVEMTPEDIRSLARYVANA